MLGFSEYCQTVFKSGCKAWVLNTKKSALLGRSLMAEFQSTDKIV